VLWNGGETIGHLAVIAVLAAGVLIADIGVIDADGRIRQITSFWEDMVECVAEECRCEQAT
jgi:NhaP-type Na+/H+ or K+/H+ antiporter